MWRIVCVGPGPLDRVRRIEDRGPLHPDRARVDAVAAFLRSTGLYESVKIVGSAVLPVAVAAPEPSGIPEAGGVVQADEGEPPGDAETAAQPGD